MKIDEAKYIVDTLINVCEKYDGKEKEMFDGITAALQVASKSLREWNDLKESLEECPPTNTSDTDPYNKAVNEIGLLIQDCIKEIEGVY